MNADCIGAALAKLRELEARASKVPWRSSVGRDGARIRSGDNMPVAKDMYDDDAIYAALARNGYLAAVEALAVSEALATGYRSPFEHDRGECSWCQECVERVGAMRREALAGLVAWAEGQGG